MSDEYDDPRPEGDPEENDRDESDDDEAGSGPFDDALREIIDSTALSSFTRSVMSRDLRVQWSAIAHSVAGTWVKSPQVQAVVEEARKHISGAWTANLGELLENFLPDMSGLAEALESIQRHDLPPNWSSDQLEVDPPENINQLVLEEALPLAWVPRTETLDAIMKAGSAEARMAIIDDRWEACLEDCEQQLTIETEQLEEEVRFAREAAAVLRAGFESSSQALSTNLLDTLISGLFPDYGERKRRTSEKTRASDVNEIDVWRRLSLPVGAALATYVQFWPSEDAEIPRRYSRHASVHGVSKRQYHRLNAILVLMHVTSLLKMMDYGATLSPGD